MDLARKLVRTDFKRATPKRFAAASATMAVASSHSLSSCYLALPQSRVSRSAFLTPRCPGFEIVRLSPLLHSLSARSISSPAKLRGCISQFSINSADVPGSSSTTSDMDTDSIPMPIVLIDQDSDSDATLVQLSFGDRLGALLDTMKSLKDLGLDVTKGSVATEASGLQTKFYITQFGRKVEDPDMLERIRLTIIGDLLKYHPECSEMLAMGEAFGIKAPEKKPDIDVATRIIIKDDGPKRSLLYIETADRPGLLLEIIQIMTDVNIQVESAEIDTEGLIAKDTFHVSYSGAALNGSLSQVLTNCLRYYLRRPETDEDSY